MRPLPDFKSLLAGNDSAWDEIHPVLQGVAYSVAHRTRMALPQDEAEDVAREAVCELATGLIAGKWRSLAAGSHPIEDLKALLATMTYRRIRDEERKRMAAKRDRSITESYEGLKERHEGDWDLAEIVTSRWSEIEWIDFVRLLQKLLRDPEGRKVALLIQQATEGLSYEELARQHAMKTGTIGAELSRAAAKIREELRKNSKLLQEFLDHFR